MLIFSAVFNLSRKTRAEDIMRSFDRRTLKIEERASASEIPVENYQ
jgi:hypothetical protein